MEKYPNFREVAKLPDINTVRDREYFKVIGTDHLYWGKYRSCKNWVGERFYLPCDEWGRLY